MSDDPLYLSVTSRKHDLSGKHPFDTTVVNCQAVDPRQHLQGLEFEIGIYLESLPEIFPELSFPLIVPEDSPMRLTTNGEVNSTSSE